MMRTYTFEDAMRKLERNLNNKLPGFDRNQIHMLVVSQLRYYAYSKGHPYKDEFAYTINQLKFVRKRIIKDCLAL